MPKGDSIERSSSGIPGFDDIVGGGIPRGSLVLLSGMCGTGKTTFGMQFLQHGARHKEPGIFVSLEQQTDTLIRNANLFGWKIHELIRDKLLLVKHYELYDFSKLKDAIDDMVERHKLQRVVLDSSALLGLFFEDKFKFRKALLDLGKDFRSRNITALLLTEVPEGSSDLSAFGAEEFASDGVITFSYLRTGNVYSRSIAIRKMRETVHSMQVHPLQITTKGLLIYQTEAIF